jgi:hypothetical protein
MISTVTVAVILSLLGALWGIYLPGVVLYGMVMSRSRPSRQSAVWNTIKLGLIAILGLLVLYVVVAHFTVRLLGPDPGNFMMLGFLFLGIAIGLISGGLVTWRSVQSARRRSAMSPSS